MKSDVGHLVASYLAERPEHESRVWMLKRMLEAGLPVVGRQCFPGHVTASGVVLSDETDVLLIEHRALGTWLLPGGHVEIAEADLQEAAAREVAEETGIIATPIGSLGVLDVDTHLIPANPNRGEPEHWHFDFAFLFAAGPQTLRAQEAEVTSVRWWRAQSLPTHVRRRLPEISVLRRLSDSAG